MGNLNIKNKINKNKYDKPPDYNEYAITEDILNKVAKNIFNCLMYDKKTINIIQRLILEKYYLINEICILPLFLLNEKYIDIYKDYNYLLYAIINNSKCYITTIKFNFNSIKYDIIYFTTLNKIIQNKIIIKIFELVKKSEYYNLYFINCPIIQDNQNIKILPYKCNIKYPIKFINNNILYKI